MHDSNTQPSDLESDALPLRQRSTVTMRVKYMSFEFLPALLQYCGEVASSKKYIYGSLNKNL